MRRRNWIVLERWPNLVVDAKAPIAAFLALSGEERSEVFKRTQESRQKNAVHQINGKRGREERRLRSVA